MNKRFDHLKRKLYDRYACVYLTKKDYTIKYMIHEYEKKINEATD